MIIKVPINQINEYWEVIKYAATKADMVKTEDVAAYNLELLFNLLNNKAQCLISFESFDRKINRVLIISFLQNKINGNKTMFFRTLYGFNTGSAEQWQKESMKIYQYAKQQGCQNIEMSTMNPAIIKLAEEYGFNEMSKNYQITL